MEMWKNFPLPPWGIALVKKNLCPSWEKSGASFCRRGENKTSGCVLCLKHACRAFVSLMIYLFKLRHVKQIQSVFNRLPHNNSSSSVLITYLSVQPALTLILMFLKIKRAYELNVVVFLTQQIKLGTLKSVSTLYFRYYQWMLWKALKQSRVVCFWLS